MTPLRRRILSIGIPVLVVLGAGVAGVIVHRHRTSPAYALAQAARAIHEHDRTAFERRVDVDQLSSAATDELIGYWASTTLADAAGRSGARMLGISAGMEMLDKVKPAMVSTARVNLLRAVEQGAMDSLFAAPAEERGKVHFGHLARGTMGRPPRVTGLGAVRQSGPLATAEVHLHDSVLNAPLTLRLRMERGADGWRVVRIDNAREYLTRVSRLQQARLAAENRSIRDWLTATVRLGEPRVRLTPQLYSGEFMEIVVPVTNTGRDTLTGVAVDLEYLGEPIDQENARPHSFDRIAPGQTVLATSIMVEYNGYVPWHGTLRFGTLTPRVRNVFVTMDNDSHYVAELEDWQEYMDWRDEHPAPLTSAPAAATAKS
ncbi:MAG TPA: DUF2939 domain-containing protein [Longimicrobium sp.]|uniref:DUF2939 domain-containing protein n=1 Tax=Longimicrobium sp. TaxID=2029185 RepID=UPI002ED7D22F